MHLVPTELDPKERAELGAPDRVWIVTGSRDFPDSLLDNFFVFDCPALDASRKVAERMALEQLCHQDQHPLMFSDRGDGTDASYLLEVVQAPDERKGGDSDGELLYSWEKRKTWIKSCRSCGS